MIKERQEDRVPISTITRIKHFKIFYLGYKIFYYLIYNIILFESKYKDIKEKKKEKKTLDTGREIFGLCMESFSEIFITTPYIL